VSAEEVIVNVR